MTTLDAINNMLLAINEQPIPVLDESIAEVKIALDILDQTLELVLTEGWHFNSESDVELYPDSQGYIYVPLNALFVDPTDRYKNCTVREGKLYDKDRHSFIFETPVKVDIVYKLPFDEIPIYAQKYISEKAARIFIAQTFGDPQLYQYQSQEEIEAYMILKSHEIDAGDHNLLESYRGYLNG